MNCAKLGYEYIDVPPQRTDLVRNMLIDVFMSKSDDPHDTLIMFDEDHLHDIDSAEKLVKWDVPIVGALAFKRGPNYSPLAWVREADGFHAMAKWAKGELVKVDAVGVNACAMQRGAILQLEAWGFYRPFFRYEYRTKEAFYPSEDMPFFRACVGANVPCYVDTSWEALHKTDGWVGADSWETWVADHPQELGPELNKPKSEAQPEETKSVEVPTAEDKAQMIQAIINAAEKPKAKAKRNNGKRAEEVIPA
jgi:hypothetical protein